MDTLVQADKLASGFVPMNQLFQKIDQIKTEQRSQIKQDSGRISLEENKSETKRGNKARGQQR